MPKHRRRGRGSIVRLGKDRWLVRWQDNGLRPSKTIHGKYADAERYLEERLAEVGDETNSQMTVKQVHDRLWWPDVEDRVASGSLSESTRSAYSVIWRRHIEPKFGDAKACSVDPIAVQAWLKEMSLPNAKLARSVMFQLFNRALMYGVIRSNPMAVYYTMPVAKTDRDAGTWSLEELRDEWKSMHGGQLEAPFLLMAFGGLRVSEALGVMGSDVAMEDRFGVPVARVQVVRQATRDHSLTERMKTKSSRRTTAVPGPMGVRLAELAAASQGLLLADDFGRPFTATSLRGVWTGAHPARNLRNTWETFSRWTLHMEPWIIEHLMGHIGDGVTGRHYERPLPEMCVDAVAEAYSKYPFADTWVI